MAKTIDKLSDAKVKAIKKPGRYGDGGGLYLQVSQVGENVTKSWLFRFMIDGTARQMGLGSVNTFSLAEARDAARDARKLVHKKIDPIAARDAENAAKKIEAAKNVTFRECAEKYIAAHEASWRNHKHRAQWHSTLAAYAYPVTNALPVAMIDTTIVRKIIEPIWQTKPETASRIRQRVEAVLDWATAAGLRSGDNPARWKGHLDKLLPAIGKVRSVRHYPALPYAEMPAFMGELRDRDSISARALELTILCTLRTGEVIHAKWGEINEGEKLWTIPGDRMKAKKEHRVPLSDRALEILKSLPREQGSDFLFPGARAGAPLSNMAMLELMRGMRPGYVPHGFRSTFRDWAAERTGYPNHVVEMALAHAIESKVEAAYRRGELLEKRRRLMADWAKYCAAKPAATSGKVTPIRAA